MKFTPFLKWAIGGHLLVAPLFASTVTWNGSGGDNNWSTTVNWGGVAPVNGDALVFSGASRLANTNDLLTSVGAVNFTSSGFTISGNALTLNGDVTNAGTNTWAINSTWGSARTITSNSGLLTFSGSITNGGFLTTVAGAGNTTISGGVGGSGGILKTGSGTLILSGVNTYTGTTRITGGTLSITSDANLGTAAGLATASSLVIDSGILSTSGTFTLNANRGIAIGPTSGQGDGTFNVTSGELTYGGIITSNTGSGTGNLVKTGSGTLTLNGANTYTGNTTISAGTLKMGSLLSIPSGSGKGDLTVNGTLDLNNFNASINGLAGTGTITNSQAGSVTFTVGGNNKGGTFNGILQNGAGTLGLIKTGTGTITLGGNNTFSGGVTINGGIVQLANAGAINSSAPNSITFGANAASGTKLQLNGNSATVSSLATNAAPGTVVVENANASASTLTINQASNTIFAGVLQNGTGGGALSLTKSGAGTLTLSGTNIYTGNTTISAGTLQAGAATAVPSGTGTGNVVINGGATAGIFDINGFDVSINGLAGTTGATLGRIVNNRTGTTKTITIGSGDATTTFAGLVTNNTGTGGTLNLGKTGTGTLTLSNANTYTGTTAIRNGTIELGIVNALTTSTSLTLGDGTTNTSGILRLNGFAQTLGGLTTAGTGTANRVINGSATTVSLTYNSSNNSSFGGILGGPGTNENNFNLIKTGTGTLTLSGTNTFSGTTSISQGALAAGNLTTALGSGASVIVLGDASNTGTLSYTGNSATFTRGFTVSAGGGQIDSTVSGQTLTLGTTNVAASGAFTLGGAGNSSITSNVTGTGSLNKTGAGTLTLSGNNTYSGVSNIRNGTVILAVNNTGLNAATTLTLGDATANTNGVLKLDGYSQTLASLLKTGNGTGNRVVGGNSILSNLTLNNAGNVTYAGILGGTGTNENNLALTKTAAGILTLSGTNTYTGGTTISAGTIAISASNNLGNASGALNIGAGTLQITSTFSSGRTLNLTDPASAVSINTGVILTDTGVISGTGALNLTGLGNLVLSGTSNAYTGGTKIQNGTLTLGAANALPTATVLTLGAGANGGKLVLNGNSQTVSGLTTSGGGTNSVVNGKVTAATFTINNTSNYAYSGILGGIGTNENAFAVTKTGSGILTLSGNNTYAGDTTISDGTLQIGIATTLPSGVGKGNVSIGTTGTLDLAANSISINGLTGTGLVTSSVSGAKTLTVGNNDQTSTFGGIVQNGTGTVSLTKAGLGILTLSGANTYTGTTTVTLGTIKIGNALAIPTGLGKGNVALTGSLDLNGTSITINGLSGTGGISSNVAGAATISVGDSNQTSSYGGIISNGSGTLGLTKVGTGTLTLTGVSTYTGATQIKNGTLTLGTGNDRLPTATTLTLGDASTNDSGIFSLNARTQNIAGLLTTGTGTNNRVINGSATVATLTVTNTGSNNYTGILGGSTANDNNFILTKAGAGVLTLSGNNTFTGGLVINTTGIVQVGNSGALNSTVPNSITFGSAVAAGTKLQLNGFTITIGALSTNTTAGSATVENANATAAGLTVSQSTNTTYAGVIIDGTGGALSLTKTGTGTLTLSGTNTYTGGTTLSRGILSIGSDANIGFVPVSASAGNIVLNGGTLSANNSFTLSSNRGIALGPTSGSGSGTIDVAATRTLSYGGIMADNGSGSGSLVKSGTGILTLSSTASTYTGGTSVASGLLNVTATTGTPLGANTLGNNIDVVAGANLSLSATANKGLVQTITVNSTSGAKGGIGFSNIALTQAQLSGMFTDNTGSDGGVLSINNGITYATALNLSTFGSGASLGTWFLGSASTGTYSPVTLTVGAGNLYRLGGGNGALTLSTANVLTGSNSVQVGFAGTNGTGTVTLSNSQNYTGITSVLGGTLSIGADNRLGAVPGSPTAGNIVLNGGALSSSATFTLSANRGIAVGPASGSGTGTLDVASGTLTYAGIIANNGSGTGALTKTGTGTLVLSGNSSTYTGPTNLNAGITSFTGINDLGLGTAISFAGGTLLWASGNAADITTRAVTTANATVATLDIGANNVAFGNSAITGSGAIIKAGSGNLTLNVANTYTGATTFSAGTVTLGINGALPSASVLTINSSTLNLNGLDTTVANLTGNASGRINNDAVGTNKTLTVSSVGNSTYSGIIADNSGTGGTIALAKTGTSTLTLAGTNAYTGGTTISAGTLSITSDANLGATSGSLVITGGATLLPTGTFTLNASRPVSIGPSGATAATIALPNGSNLTYNGVISNSGSATGGLIKSNSGNNATNTLTLGGANTYAGDTTISGGTLQLANAAAIPFGTGKGNVAINTSATSVATLDLFGKVVTINGLSGNGGITNSSATAASLTVGANDQTSTYSGIISNGGSTVSLGKTGTGTLTLSGISTYSGTTTISGGTLSISADGNIGAAPGSTTPGSLVINGGILSTTSNLTLGSTRGIAVGPSGGSGFGTLAPATGITLTYNGIIANNGSGTGGLTKSNTTGTLVLGGANTYSGDTTISGGTLQLGNVAAIPSGSGKGNLTLASGSSLDLNNLSPTVNGLTGGGTVTNSLTSAVTFAAGGNNATSSFSGIIQDGNGTTSFTKTGTGTLTLGGLNTYSGNTTVSGGTLQLGIASALPSGLGKGNLALTGNLDLNGFATTVNGLVGTGTVTNSSATAAILTAGANDQSSTFSGNFQNGTGTVGFTKTGTGTLTLSGNNTHSGATTISTGTLSVGSTTALSANSTVTIAAAGFLDVNGYDVTIDGLLGTGTLNNNGASPSTLNAGAGGASTQFDGVIADGTNTIALTKSGAGTLTLTGVNTYSGTTTIANGTVSVANPGAGGNLGTASSAIILGDLSNKGILSYTGNADLAFTRGFTVNNGGGEIDITSSGRMLTLQTGGIVTTGTFTVGGAGNALVSSVISGSGGFTKSNTGTMLLSSVNTYTGDTTLTAGTLQVTNAAAIPSGTGKGNVAVNGSSVLDVNNLSLTLNGLSGSGTVTNSQGAPVLLTVGDNNATSAFTGVVQDGAGTTSLTKTGTGTLTLGGANTYSGDTAISSGTIKIANAAALASGTYKGNISIAAPGTLDLNDYDMTLNGLTGAGLVTNNAGASILSLGANDQTSTFIGNIQDGLGTIGFTKTGTGNLTLSGNNTFTGASTISAGSVTIGSATALSPGSTLTIGSAGTLDLNGRVIAIDGLAGTGSLTNNGAADVTLTTGSSGGSGTFGGTLNDGISKIALVKTGAGTVALTNFNSYSGGTTVTGGTLAITADNVLGFLPLANTPGNIVLNGGALSAVNTFALDPKRGIVIGPAGVGASGTGRLDVALNQTLTYGGVITDNGSGTGSLVKSGSGTLTLTNVNTYSGDTLISSGTLQIGNTLAMASGAGHGNLTVDGTLDLNNFSIVTNGLSGTGTVSNTKTGSVGLTAGANDQTSTFAGTLQNGNGTVALTKTGTGILTLSGNNSYTGGTTNSLGTLALASPGALGSTGTISMNGGTLQFSAANTVDYSPRIVMEDGKTATFDTNGQNVTFGSTLALGAAGTGSLVKQGLGTLTITGSSTYTGSTTVSTGTLFVNGTIGNTAVSVAAGATLGGAGNIGGNVTVTGTLTPGEDAEIGNLGLNSLDLVNSMLIQWDGTSNFIDHVDVTNLLSLQSGSSLTFSSLGGTLTQSAYVFATYGSLSAGNNLFGTINNLPADYHIEYNYGPGMNQIALVIPEPRTALLGVIGVMCILKRRRSVSGW
ncbi:autotransporter-associated beta strand repeat-containing protein [Luteolibacter sp.]|uniref:beta strand repeat-containing protein n=1 Tax=Luteolibacter sp. TaxID=1962973 RepID=UPI00326523F7